MVAVLFFSLVWVSLMWTAQLQIRSAFEDFVLFCFVLSKKGGVDMATQAGRQARETADGSRRFSKLM